MLVDLNSVTGAGTGIGILESDDGTIFGEGTPHAGTAYAEISHNTVHGFASGIALEGATSTANIHDNTGSIYGNAVGIDVNGGTATISGNHIYNNTTGVRFANGGNGSVTGNDFDGSTDNTTDLRLDSTAGAVTIGALNNFAGDTYFIDNQTTTQNFNLTGLNAQNYDEASNYRIEDKMYHKVDVGTLGLITWSANNVYVTTPGLDSTDSSIQRGVDAVPALSTGWTVNVEAGTYEEQVIVTKGLRLLGDTANPDNVVIDGENKTTLTASGQVRIDNPTGPVVFEGFKIVNSGEVAGAGERFDILTKSSQPVTIQHVELIGHGAGLPVGEDYGLWATGSSGALTIQDTYFTQMYHGILLERQTGVSTISGNTFDNLYTGPYGSLQAGGRAIEAITYGGTNVTATQTVSGNHFVNFASTGVQFSGGFSGETAGTFTDVVIEENDFTFVPTTIFNLNGAVYLTNANNPAGGVTATVRNNTIRVPSGIGINVAGSIAQITGNSINGSVTGIRFTGGGSGTVSGNDFDDATDNGTDLRLDSSAGTVTIGAGNLFAGETFFIDNQSTQSFDLTSYTSANFEGLADNFRIEDKMHHRMDTDLPVTTGLVTWVADNVYVTAPGVGSTDSSIQRGIDAASTNDIVHVEGGTISIPAVYTGALNVNKSVTISGAGEDLVTVDVNVTTEISGSSGIEVAANGVNLTGFTVQGLRTNSAVRYGIDSAADDLSIAHVTVEDMYRSGLNFNGATNLVLDDVSALNNGGSGIGMTDVRGAALSNITTSGNVWNGVSVMTWGRYHTLGTTGIVFSGTNSFGEVTADNGGLQLEEGNYADPTHPYAITWSTSLADGANVTILSADFGYALGGPQAMDDGANVYNRARFYQTLGQAQSAAAGSPDHFEAHDRFIRTTNALALPTNYYVFDVAGEKMSIQAAANDAKATDAIHVAAGTFVEQVDIGKNVTVTGAGDATVIQSPASLTAKFSKSGYSYYPVVTVHDTNATIEDVMIDGRGMGNANYRFVGLAFYNAGGTADNVTIIGIRETPFSGSQQGAGIYAYNADSATRTLNITNGHISDYQKGGIVATGAGLTANITGNVVTGRGDTPLNAQNGIQVSSGAVGHISDNTVSGHEYSGTGDPSGPDWLTQTQATGIILSSAGAGTTVTNNNVDGNDIGIASIGSDATISGNQLATGLGDLANRYYGILVDGGTVSATGNQVVGGNVGLAAYSAGTRVSLSGNVIHTGSGIGVLAHQATAKIQANDLTGNSVGIQVQNGALVDAGDVRNSGAGLNVTGLGSSTGNNLLTGYTGVGGNYAIKDLNTVAGAQPDVMAQNNSFGAYVVPSIVENYVFDDTDDATRTQVIYTPMLTPASAAVPVVYVDDSWAAVPLGVDPDGVGPATKMGVDAFTRITDGVAEVTAYLGATPRVVNVLDGTYTESNITITKGMTIDGQDRAGVVLHSLLVDSHEDSSFGGAVVSNGFVIGASDVTIKDLSIDGQAGQNFRNGIITDYNAGVYGNIDIDNVSMSNIYRKGVGLYVIGTGHTVGNSVTNSFFDHIGTAAALGFEGNGAIAIFQADTVVDNNEISYSAAGILSNYFNAEAQAPRLTVTNNRISNPLTYSLTNPAIGMDLSGLADGSIIGGPALSGDANTIDMTGGTNHDIGIAVQYAVADADITVQGNTLTMGAGDTGIRLFQNPYSAHPVLVDLNSVTGAGTGIGILESDDGTIFGEGTPHAGTAYADISHNIVHGFAAGIALEGATSTANIHDNTGSIYGNAVGIDVNGGTATISGNHIYNNTTGVRFANGGNGSLTGNNFDGTTANGTDLLIASSADAANVTINDGNAFAGSVNYIQNLSTRAFDLSGLSTTTFGGFNAATTAVTAGNLATFYGVEDKIVDYLDNASDGYLRIKQGYDFVAHSSEVANAGAIQRGVNAANTNETTIPANGDVVEVQAGSYYDNVTVSKMLTINGAGQGSTIVYTAVSNPTGGSLSSSTVFMVDSNNVTIENLTVDGDNPLLNGAAIDASTGIITNWDRPDSLTGFTVKNVTVQNVYLRGIEYANGDDFGTGIIDIENNTVTNVQGDPDGSIAIFNFGGHGLIKNNTVSYATDAIAANWSTGTEFLNNHVTHSGSGVHTDNALAVDLIEGNDVSLGTTGSYGVFVFVPYVDITVRNNDISGVDVGLGAFGGAGGRALFTNNTVSVNAGGAGALVTTDTIDWGQMDVSASFSGGSFTGGGTGILVEQGTGATATATISGVTIADPVIGIDVTGGSATITGNFIYDNTTGIRFTTGGHGSVTGNDFNGPTVLSVEQADNGTDLRLDDSAGTVTIGAGNHFAGDTFYIDNQTTTQNFDLTGANAQTYDETSNFRIEDKMFHKMDDPAKALGLITWVNGNLYVTEAGTDHSIQRAIDIASDGNTVNVEAGTYVENVLVNKKITLDGVGSGGTAADTIIAPVSGNGIELAASGASTSDRVVVKDLRVQGAANGIYVNSAVSHLTLDNVAAVNDTYGIEIHNAAVVTDLVLNNPTLTGNGTGLRVATSGRVNGLTVTGGTVSNNQYGFNVNADSGSTANQNDFTNISIKGTEFSNNLYKGMYFEKLDHAVIGGAGVGEAVTLTNNGTGAASPAGIDINLKYGVYSDIALNHVTMTGNGTGDINGAGLAIKGRNDGSSYSGNPATLTGVSLDHVTITGSPVDLSIGNNTNGVTFTDVALGGTGRGLVLWTTAPQAFDIGNTSFAGSLASYIENGTASTVDALDAVFPDAGADRNFRIEDKVGHKVDLTALGLVTWVADNVYVTNPAVGIASTDSSIQRGIDAASNNDTVNVEAGTYAERLTIAKPLTLLGAQANVDPTAPGARGVPGNETTVTEAGLSDTNPNVLVEITVGGAGTVINGFTLVGDPTDANADASVVRDWASNVTVADNIVNGKFGVIFKGGDSLTAASNRFTINGTGVTVQPNAASNVTISGNTFTRGASPASDARPIYMTGVTGGSVTGNVGTGFAGGEGIAGSNNQGIDAAHPLVISGNTFSGDRKGISLWGNTQYVHITGNTLTNNVSTGIEIKGAHLNIAGNTIAGTPNGVVLDRHTINTTDVSISGNDFRGASASTTNNWIDLTIMPAVTDFTVGDGNRFAGDVYYIDDLNAQNLDLTATTGTTYGTYNPAVLADNFRIEDRMYHKVDSAASGLINWVANEVYVTAPGTHSTLSADSDSSIQRGIDAANAGDTVNVEAGTYALTGDIGINKAITLRGPNSLISPNTGVRDPEAVVNGGDAQRIRIGTSDPVSVEGLQLSHLILDSYTADSQITFDKNVIDHLPGNMFFNAPDTFVLTDNHISATAANWDALLLAGDWNGTTGTEVTIQDNVIDNAPTASGFNLSSVHGTISNNRFEGIAYYGLLLANDTNVSVTGNRFISIDNPNPTASPTWGAGVRFYTPGAHAGADISGNWFTDNYNGIGVRLGSATAGLPISISANVFSGNTYDIVNQGNGNLTPAGTNVFDGVTLSGATTSELYSIADKMVDAVDVSGYGLVQLKAGNIYVTPSSFLAAGGTTAASIQRAVNAASNGNVVHIQAGSYTGDVDTTGKILTLDLGASPAQVTVNGNLNLAAGSTVAFELNGHVNPATDYDNFVVTGAVSLGAAFDFTKGYTPVAGDGFMLINNDGTADAITGTFTFNGLPVVDGGYVYIAGTAFQADYQGGDGNDLVLTAQAAPTTVWVNDTWTEVLDGDGLPGIGLGDTVSSTLGAGDAVVINKLYGIDAFSTVQAGVNAVAATGTVEVLAGSYYQSNITINNPMTIDGYYTAGGRSQVVVGPSIADEQLDSTWGGTISNGLVINSSGVTIQDLTVDGDADNGLTGDHNFRAGIITDSAHGSEFDNITVHNVAVQNTYRRGIQIYSPDVVGTGNSITDSSVDDVVLGPGIAVFDANVTITGTQVSNTISGIEITYWGAGAPLATVQGNTLTNVESGIQLVGPAAGSIVGGAGGLRNTITLTGTSADRYGILVRSAQGTVTVQNNSVTGTGAADGIVLFGNGDATHPALIKDNLLSTGGVGISMSDDGELFPDGDNNPIADHSDYATITGNTITGFAIGMELEQTGTQSVVATVGDGTSAGANTITPVGGGIGILVDGAGATATVQKNTVTLAGNTDESQGIVFQDGAAGAISGNTVNSGEIGIWANNTGTISRFVTISGNEVTGAMKGIEMFDADYTHVTGDTVTGSTLQGIWDWHSDHVTIDGANILSGNYTGIDVDDAHGLLISGNTVSGSALNNIELVNITDSTVSDNQVSGGNNGILVWTSSSNQITGNTVSGSASNGIYLYNSDGNVITSNAVSGVHHGDDHDGWGIALDNGSTGNTVTLNNVHDSDVGVWVGGGSTGNTIGGSGNILTSNYIGLQIQSGGSATVLDNTITGNTTVGVDVDGGTAMLQGNDLRSNTIGLLIHNGAVVDAGQTGKPVPSNFSGLGISTGGNDFSSYTAVATVSSGAIVDLNTAAAQGPQGVPSDATAFGNTWNAALTTPAQIGAVIYDDVDFNANAFVDYANPGSLSVAATPATEGQTVTLSGSFTNDPQAHTVTINWGDTTSSTVSLVQGVFLFNAGHVYADNQTYTINVSVADSQGNNVSGSTTVAVSNVAATVNAGVDQPANEGQTVNVAATFNDLGTADTHTAAINWGDGIITTGATLVESPFGPPGSTSGANGTVSGSHVYADEGVYTVTVTVTDDNGGVSSDTLTVTVGNVAATVNAGVDQTASEGQLVSLAPATFNDLGTADTHTATIDWGDGSAVAVGSVTESPFGPAGSTAGANGSVGGSHVYADNGAYTVTVTVTDDNGGVSSDTLTVTVGNVAATVNAGVDQTASEGQLVSLAPATFNDLGTADTHTATIDWGDGSAVAVGSVTESPFGPAGSTAGANGSVGGSHVYADNGAYTVTVTVTDDNGGVSSDTLTVTVGNVAATVKRRGRPARERGPDGQRRGDVQRPRHSGYAHCDDRLGRRHIRGRRFSF